MQDKIKLIDEICTRHPAYGVDKGWSEYTGGMKDTGEWFFRKMLDVPQKELQDFLNIIIEEENKPRQPELIMKHRMYKPLYIKDMEIWMVWNPMVDSPWENYVNSPDYETKEV